MPGDVVPSASEQGHSASPAAEVAAAEKWTREKLLWLRPWNPTLYSFATTRNKDYAFTPGQFARLGLAGSGTDAGTVWRAYSLLARPLDDFLEFICVAVPGGAFTGRLAQTAPGDEILVEKSSYGFLTTARFSGGRDLWMLGSGTGIGPYLSILREGSAARAYENLILVHSVRRGADLAYVEEIAAMAARSRTGERGAQLHYVPVVTREACPGALDQRIPALIEGGKLQQAVGLPLDLERSRLMICGNPELAAELRHLLTERGFRVGRRGESGQLAFENYW
jgi:ferredoxin--NADP+ reductase